MAQRRMFSPEIVNSDAFLEMPPSTQALYFQLGMKADDDGFVNPKMVMRTIGSSDDEIKVLLAKRFVLPFENGVLVIKHWRINNFVRKDRYKETLYLKEKSQLFIRDNQSYTDKHDENSQPVNELPWKSDSEIRRLGTGQPAVDQRVTQVRVGKGRVGKVNKEASPIKKFKEPTLKEVEEYCKERNNAVRPQQFIDFYASKGWKVGNQKMKDWQACVRTWEQRDAGPKSKVAGKFENVKSTKI